MRGGIICIVLIPLLPSCGLLQTTTKNTKKDYLLEQHKLDLKVTANMERNGSFNILDISRDSLSSTYRILLWPKGSFTFSPEMGFVGEAEKIEISGTLEQLNAYSGMMNMQEQQKVKVEAAVEEQNKMVAEQKGSVVSSTYSLKWLVAGLILIGAAVFWVYKR